ncbi:hypothetical protein EYR40_003410 [Pleurotus pulmonarius]|nr:hypothetical protein EYR40_003410 [Pleurotus pulmonarius]KAF4606137.1 hypothetical protein EYR38_000182 [Pleurotus pulmonarius]
MFKSLSLLSFVFAATALAQQTGQTTRYWYVLPNFWYQILTDIRFANQGLLQAIMRLADVSQPVLTCNAQGSTLTDPDVKSGCDGGSAFTCTNNSPWAVNDSLAYGFAAVSISGSSESRWCCACYELTFTSGPVAGKRMVVQATNTGGDLGSNHFDILMPGGGVGIFNGCPAQFGSWNGGADNPSISFREVQCPSALTSISGCSRHDGSGLPTVTVGPSTPTSSSSSSSAPSNPTTTTTPGGGGGGGAAQYAQCGGIGWSGATTCVSPFTCTKLNDYVRYLTLLCRKGDG